MPKVLCNYSHHKCHRFRYHNYGYCFQHLLQDKSTLFIPCHYISKITSRRCHNPVYITEQCVKVLCDLHNQNRENSSFQRSKSRKTETTKNEYFRQSKIQSREENLLKSWNMEGYSKSGTPLSMYIDTKSNGSWMVVASYCTSSEADIDANSCGSEDPLGNAGAFSLEEVNSKSQNQLVELQSLYIKQLDRLTTCLQKRKMGYLLEEAADITSTYPMNKATKLQDEILCGLQPLINYRKQKWKEHFFYLKSKHRRLKDMSGTPVKSIGISFASPNRVKCGHIWNHVRCKSFCLPYTKFCAAHILQDSLQVLYKRCSKKLCSIPVCQLFIDPIQYCSATSTFENDFCCLHQFFFNICHVLDGVMLHLKNHAVHSYESQTATPTKDIVCSKESLEDSRFYSSEGEFANVNQEPLQDNNDSSQMFSVELHKQDDIEEQLYYTADASTVQKFDSSSTDEDADKVSSFSPNNDIYITKLQKKDDQMGQSHLFPTTLNSFKSGQRFLMNRIAIFDETRNMCQSAIHLEPVEPSSLDIGVKSNVEAHYNVPPFSCNTSRLDLKISLDSNRENLCDVPVLHQGVVMSVDKTADEFSVKTSKVAASATIIPPTLEKENNKAAETNSVSLMPSLASIASTDSIWSPEIELMQSYPFSTLQDDVSIPCSIVKVTEEMSTISTQLGEDVANLSFENDRKPSSVDEETAVASLLFLSTGSIHKTS